MAIERTLSLIKPEVLADNKTGEVIQMFENAGFKIIASKRIRLTKPQAQEFYGVHKTKPFFNELVDYISSAPIIAQVLEKENAVLANRELMGATDPAKAEDGTIRKKYGKSIQSNAVHGSDSLENAEIEISFFFPKMELV
jgi:nucleoside-diphosphate kinase